MIMQTFARGTPSLLRSAVDAALIMAIGMGFGRFAFTAIYPHMVQEGVLSLHGGSLAASANYLGYLVGAVLGMKASAATSHRLCLWSVAGTVVCLCVLALLDNASLIVLARGAAGVFSALTMVAASLWLLQHRGHQQGAPLLYGGVGIGIVISAELLVLGGHVGLGSHGLWMLLGVAALIIGLLATPGLLAGTRLAADDAAVKVSGAAMASTTAASASALPTAQRSVRTWPLVTVYGLAGLGYIVTATYLPLLVKTALPDLESAHVWAIFGLSAVPSCFLWHRVHQALGTRSALGLNMAVQAIGVACPIVMPSATGYVLSALLVGGTFLGTPTIVMPAAQRLGGRMRTNAMAVMTLVYGMGQIAGPLLTNLLYAQSQSFVSALAAAAAALVMAALLSRFAL